MTRRRPGPRARAGLGVATRWEVCGSGVTPASSSLWVSLALHGVRTTARPRAPLRQLGSLIDGDPRPRACDRCLAELGRWSRNDALLDGRRAGQVNVGGGLDEEVENCG